MGVALVGIQESRNEQQLKGAAGKVHLRFSSGHEGHNLGTELWVDMCVPYVPQVSCATSVWHTPRIDGIRLPLALGSGGILGALRGSGLLASPSSTRTAPSAQ
eukprot:8539188-Pyramimonas_sp.AAC.1